MQAPVSVNSQPAVLLDLNVLVPNLPGAFQEGLAAAFRMFDMELEEDMLHIAVGPYVQGVRAVFRECFPREQPSEERVHDLSQAYKKVVRRFVQFSSSLRAIPRLDETITALHASGYKVGLCSDLDPMTLGILMSRLGWNGAAMFNATVTSEDGSTKAEMLSAIMNKCRVKAGSDAAYFGAMPSDVHAALQSGVGQILMLDQEETFQHNSGIENAERCRFSELPDVLKEGRQVNVEAATGSSEVQ